VVNTSATLVADFIPPKPFSHVKHPMLAVKYGLTQGLAFGRQIVNVISYTVRGKAELFHHAVGMEETVLQQIEQVFAGRGHRSARRRDASHVLKLTDTNRSFLPANSVEDANSWTSATFTANDADSSSCSSPKLVKRIRLSMFGVLERNPGDVRAEARSRTILHNDIASSEFYTTRLSTRRRTRKGRMVTSLNLTRGSRKPLHCCKP